MFKVKLKKGVLRYFARLTGKHLCQSICYNKVAGLWWLLLPFLTNFPRYTPLETSENQRFFGVSKGCKIERLARNRFKKMNNKNFFMLIHFLFMFNV